MKSAHAARSWKIEKVPFEQRSLYEQLSVNLRKSRKLLSRREYSMAIVRACTCLDLYVTELLARTLKTNSSGRFSIQLFNALLRKPSIHEKLTSLMKQVYGFSAKKEFPREYAEVHKAIQKRNRIVHKGIFANKAEATAAVDAVESLIKKMRIRILEERRKIRTK